MLAIPIAVGAALYKIEWFFPAMLLMIGGRYLTFTTLYGIRLYWAFGAVLAGSAVALIVFTAPAYLGALAGALIEYVFAAAILLTRVSRGGRASIGATNT